MKFRSVVAALFLLAGGVAFAFQDNSPIKGNPVAPHFDSSDYRWVIRFTTTVPANTSTLIVGTMTAKEFDLAPQVAVSTGSSVCGLASSTSTTFGGRSYMSLQIVSAPQNVYWDLSSVDLSTTTSNYLQQGQYLSPDDPYGWQGPLYMMSTNSFTVTGQIWMNKQRPQ